MNSTTTRNATLADLAEMLQDQHTRKVDIVAPAHKIRSVGGVLQITGAEAEISLEGVTTTDGNYTPTQICDEGIAQKLSIPNGYLKRMREERPDLYDANLNGWLHGCGTEVNPDDQPGHPDAPVDPRSFLVRCFRGENGENGIARAFLSDSYRMIDHIDALTAALDGVKQSGANVQIDGCDLTDRRMYVRIKAPEVTALAPVLLENYRSPFGGASGRDLPIVSAGLVISNSETGGGAFSIVPRLVVEVCSNGMTMNKDAVRAIHLGEKMDEGVVDWSDDTRRKNLELITAKARDSVTTFLDVAYMEKVIRQIEQTSTVQLNDAATVVQNVGKRLFSAEQTSGILDHFIRGGDTSAGGVLHAVTSFAQTIEDADVASEMESLGIKAMEMAATI